MLSPKVLRALTSPTAFLAFGVGAAAGILLGLGLGAVLTGLVGYGIRVALSMPRRPGNTLIDPFAVGEPWRRFVSDARSAQARFQGAVRSTRQGPLRDRMAEIGARVDEAVEECWLIAQRGHAIDKGIGRLETREARDRLTALQAEAASPARDATIAALQSQIASEDRLRATSADAQQRLRLLDARMDEAVAKAVELSATSDEVAMAGLDDSVGSLLSEMESLRLALEETGGGQTQTGTA
jgi:hypothetical protein